MLSNTMRIGLMLGVAASAIAAPAFAQEKSTEIEAIVVTAQKRAENLQDVPIAVSAITAATLQASGVRGLDQLSVKEPGLVGVRGSSAVNFYIRGVGTLSGSAGAESPIATFVDGVYQPSLSGTVFALNNVERVEVLKGPQGTLYGRNATGGAINVITRAPSKTPSMDAEVLYGNHDTLGASFYGTTGLGDRVAIDLAAYINDMRDGFGRNVTTGKHANTRKDTAIRSKMLIDVTDDLKVTLAGDYSVAQGSYSNSPRLAPGSVGVDGGRHNVGFWDSRTNVDTRVKNRLYGGSVRVDYDLGDVQFLSLSAYREVRGFLYGDLDMGPLPLFQYPLTEKDRQYTQEFQLLGDTGGKLKWSAGVFYLEGQGGFNPFYAEGAALAPALYIKNHTLMDTKSIAAYGQATYALTPQTNLTAGLRYTRDKRSLHSRNFVGLPTGPVQVALIQDQKTYKEPTWRLAIDHHISEDVMAYASYSRGFKSGAYNTSSPTDPAVRPEQLDAYEAGFKATLLDRSLQFNGSTFFYKYKDIQLTKIVGASQLLLNAATAESYGVEFDLKARLSRELSLNAGLQWLHAIYKDFKNAPVSVRNPAGGNTFVDCVANPVGCDASGNRMVASPKWTGSVSADYRRPVASGILNANLALAYNDGFFFEPDNRLAQKSFTLLSGQVRWTTDDERYYVRVFGDNLTNRKYFGYLTATPFGDLAQPSSGRTFGVAVGVHY